MYQCDRGELGAGLAVLAIISLALLWDGKARGDQEKMVPHDRVECSRCHDLVADLGGSQAARNLTGECLKCHQLTPVAYHGITLSFHEGSSPRCQNCHNFHQPNAIQASSRQIKTAPKSDAYLAHCISCHQQGMKTSLLSYGHQEAVSIYHSNGQVLAMLSPSEGCLLCHSNRGAGHFDNNEKSNAPRFNEMASHPYGIVYKRVAGEKESREDRPGSFTPLLIDGRIECQTCHLLTNQTNYYLAGNGDYGELCAACHEAQDLTTKF